MMMMMMMLTTPHIMLPEPNSIPAVSVFSEERICALSKKISYFLHKDFTFTEKKYLILFAKLFETLCRKI